MIPLVSLSNFVNSAVTITLAAQLIVRCRKVQHDGLRYLTGFFIFLAGFWAMRALPGILVFDSNSAMVTNLFSYVFLYIATTSLLQVPFVFIDRRELGAVLGILNIVAGIVFVLGRLFDPMPHPAIVVGQYVYWQETYAPWLRAITGLSTFISTSTFMGVFFYLGFKERANTIVYRRSMYLASGMAFLLFAASVFFLFSAGEFFVSMLASVSCIVGLLLMLRGIWLETEAAVANSTV